MEFKEITAKTVDEAITKACLEFETSSDNLEIQVVQEGTSGFLGFIGSKPAVIKVRKKVQEEEFDILKELAKEEKKEKIRCFSAPARRSSCPSCPTASCASRGRDRCRAEKEHKKRQSGPGSASRSAAPPVLFWPVPPHDPGRGQAEIWRERKFR